MRCLDFFIQAYSTHLLRSLKNLSPHHSWSAGFSAISKGPQPLEAMRITWGDCQGCRFLGPEPSWDLEIGGLQTHWEKPCSSTWPSAFQGAHAKPPTFQSHQFLLLHGLRILKLPSGLGSSFLLLEYSCFKSHLFPQRSQVPLFQFL